MCQTIQAIVATAIRQQDMLLDQPVDLSQGDNSVIYGIDGVIDSLTLVSIIVDIEQLVRAEYKVEVHLANTADLPPTSTPFATFGSLVEYVTARLSAVLEPAAA